MSSNVRLSPSSVAALPPRLRRVDGYQLDAELDQRPAHRGRVVPVHLASGLGRVPVPTADISLVSDTLLHTPCEFMYITVIYNMIDFNRLVGFDWDAGNNRKNVDKHGVSEAESEQIFFNVPLLVVGDTRHSHSETRFHTLGKTNSGRFLHITFTLRAAGTRIRIISARDMHRKERAHYEQEA